MSKQITVVDVKFLDRRDGGLRVYSDTLPELMLSGANSNEVCACIEPAIKIIFAQRGYKVTAITDSERIISIMKLPSPRNMNLRVNHRFAAAA